MGVSEGGARAVAYLGLGSNLSDPRAQVLEALDALARLPDSRLCARSSLYATAPLGPVDQPDYVNAAARIETGLDPLALLAALQGIERAQGRVRDGTRWGPRTLDLDILTYGALSLCTAGLELPHPELAKRAFVLVPLAEIAPPGLGIPGKGRLDALLAACPGRDGVRAIPDRETGAGD